MRRWFGFLVFSVAGCGGGNNSPAPPPEPLSEAGVLFGQALLFDGLDHSGTRVTLVSTTAAAAAGTSSDLKMTTTTSAVGRFELHNVPPGTYDIKFDHDTYVGAERSGVVVVSLAKGDVNAGSVTLTRASIVAGGQEITAGTKSPHGDKQFFTIDGVLNIYEQGSGSLLQMPRTIPAVGGAIGSDGKFALLSTGSSPSTSTTDSIYVARLDANAGGRLTADPILASANSYLAGISPDGTHAFVVTPNGSGLNAADVWSFTVADPTTRTQVGSDVDTTQLTAVPDPTYPSKGSYIRPVYAQLAYQDNPHVVGAQSVYDFNLFSTNSGGVLKIPNVVQVRSLALPPNTPSSTVRPQAIIALPDTAGLTRDVYLWHPGAGDPIKLNSAAFGGSVYLDDTSSPGHVLLLASDGVGGTSVSAFEQLGTPNLRVVLPNLLWSTSSNLRGTAQSYGRKLATDKWLILGRTGTAADLVLFDFSAPSATTLQSNVTRAGGGTLSSSDYLTSSSIMFSLNSTTNLAPYAFNTNASGSTLTPGVVDAIGAVHALSGSFDAASFSSSLMKISDDGTTLAFRGNSSTLHVAKLNGTGITPTAIPLASTTSIFALNGDGASLAYAIGTQVFTVNADGSGTTAVIGDTGTVQDAGADAGDAGVVGTPPNPYSIQRIWLYAPTVVAWDSNYRIQVAKAGVPAGTGMIALTSSFSTPSVWGFADGNRVLVSNSSTLAEVNTAVYPATVGNTYTSFSTGVFMNGVRTRAALLSSMNNTVTALRSDGSRDTQTGTFSPLSGAGFSGISPSGKIMYLRDTNSGRVIAYDETGGPIEIGKGLNSTSSSVFRTLGGGSQLVFIDVWTPPGATSSRRDLIATPADAPARTEVVTGLVGTFFDTAPTTNLSPWITSDGNSVFGIGDVNAGSTAQPPPKPALRLATYTTTAKTLGDNVSTTPAPQLDPADATSLVFWKNKDSLMGTATVASYPLAGPEAVVLAENVRSLAYSPDGSALTAVILKDGKLTLASGPKGTPATAMGPVGFTAISTGNNLAWSDDAKRVFAFDTASTGAGTTSGMLVAGAVGTAGLVNVTARTLGVFPDGTGKQAAVVTKNVGDNAGLTLSRYVTQ